MAAGTTDQPARLWTRTGPALLRRAGVAAAMAVFVDLAVVDALDALDWVIAIWLICFLSLCLLTFRWTTEWTITDDELQSRHWLSLPGRKPETVMAIGPQFEVVHESRMVWRIRPHGSALNAPSWNTAALKGPMEHAGVRVTDWRGDWVRRHRLLDRFGVLAYFGGAIGMLLVVAQGPWWPYRIERNLVEMVAIGVMLLGWAIDYLPWKMRKPSVQKAENR
jgi:hypothetical protein